MDPTLMEIRRAMTGRTIRAMTFAHDNGEIRAVVIKLDDGTRVTLTATAYQSLSVGI